MVVNSTVCSAEMVENLFGCSVLHVNTRNMLAHNSTVKLDEIDILAAEYTFVVICLTETWLDTSVATKSMRFNGYSNPFRLSRNWHGVDVFA